MGVEGGFRKTDSRASFPGGPLHLPRDMRSGERLSRNSRLGCGMNVQGEPE